VTDFNVQTFLITNMDDITEEYRTSLADLTQNSKPLINMLTMLAEDNETHAAKIVDVIETHLQQV
jgi:pre-mRNA cleavage complex 2 protein Pcf11